MAVEASYATVSDLQRSISTEALVALGLPRAGPLQKLLRPLVWLPTHRFAKMAAEFDRRVAQDGLSIAAGWALSLLLEGYQLHGGDCVPSTGPLVVISNHPGSYDVLLIAAALGREDLRIPASDVPFLRNLVATSSHLIYTDTGPNAHARMAVARQRLEVLERAVTKITQRVNLFDKVLIPGTRANIKRIRIYLSDMEREGVVRAKNAKKKTAARAAHAQMAEL